MTEKLEIVNERLLPAEPTAVFNAVADPKTLALWWGPHGFTNRIDEFDFRVGGDWRVTMTSSDGTDFANRWTFHEIEPARRLVAPGVDLQRPRLLRRRNGPHLPPQLAGRVPR